MSGATSTALVLMGGPDMEREVSLMSGREVAAALREGGAFTVIERVIDRPTADELHAMAKEANAEVVFPVLHGHWGEGGPLQSLLEEIDLPYVGSRPTAARNAMNKIVTKSLLTVDEVPTPRSRQLTPDDTCDLDPPLVLKPVDDGSSVDLRICRTSHDVDRARRELHPKRGLLMAEQYIEGREVTAGILFDELLPLIEIVPAVEYYDYEAKYTREDTRYIIDPELPAGVAEQCLDIAMRVYRRLGCRDVARVDFIVNDRGPWFLEINTMPGFTTHSLVPMAARARDMTMPNICTRLVRTALSRGVRPDPLAALGLP